MTGLPNSQSKLHVFFNFRCPGNIHNLKDSGPSFLPETLLQQHCCHLQLQVWTLTLFVTDPHISKPPLDAYMRSPWLIRLGTNKGCNRLKYAFSCMWEDLDQEHGMRCIPGK